MDPKVLFGLVGCGIVGFIGFGVGLYSWDSVCSLIPNAPGSFLKFDLTLRSCPLVGDVSRETFGYLTGAALGAVGLIGGVISAQRKGATT